MGISLGANQYGKAENRVVRVYRGTGRHEIVGLNVLTWLRGDFSAAHVSDDQRDVLPAGTQKNTAFAYAKEHGVASVKAPVGLPGAGGDEREAVAVSVAAGLLRALERARAAPGPARTPAGRAPVPADEAPR